MTMKQLFLLLFLICLGAGPANASIIDAPHNETNNISCVNCHNYSLWWQYSPLLSNPQLRSAKTNTVCLTCHGDSGPEITEVTHASAAIGPAHRAALGDWSRACIDCHDPHFQDQLNWSQSVPADTLYLVTGALVPGSLSVTGNGTPSSPYYSTFKYQNLIINAAGWDNATTPWTAKSGTAGRGLILTLPISTSDNTYEITGVNEGQSEVTVRGRLKASYAADSTKFGLIYGQLIRDQINVYGTMANVKFFNPKGGFVHLDNNDGICQVCHTKTRHFRNTGGINATTDGYDHSGQVTANCITCHSHHGGFAHGGTGGAAGGGGTGCVQCHGHDKGTIYDPDMTKTGPPYVPNSEGLTSIGAGTFQSHSTHTEVDSDDQRGPALYCASCHDLSNMPKFKNQDGTGNHTLAETDICNGCHSPGGTYDGVNDPVIGAKANWAAGIYNTNGTLKTGKSKWCATCHDEVPSVVKGITAPNVIGDESGTYTYGKGWGFYKTGHGLPAAKTFPSKGGVTTLSGRPLTCANCHDFTTKHIFGVARPYNDNDSSSTAPSVYRKDYRLKLVAPGTGTGVSGREPLLIPAPTGITNTASNYRLCVNCHNSGPFTDMNNMNTNMVSKGVNRHAFHLGMNMLLYPADWNGANTSRVTCITCHNVHGSTRLAMIRDGRLTGRTPGMQIWYNNDDAVYNDGVNPPQPEDLPLSASTGILWKSTTVGNLCNGCHGNSRITATYRTPFQNTAEAPTLAWTGETNYKSSGVFPGSSATGTFTFRVKYTDLNNDAPSPIEVWIDENNNGTYESNEKYALTAVNGADSDYTNGKLYTKTLSILNPAASVINYRFYASDGTSGGGNATGSPTTGGSITILNQAPVLSWTGEAGYTTDGVSPDIGGNGASFVFRVSYIDSNNTAPATVQLWVDSNDNGIYETSEKHTMTAVNTNDTTYSDGKLYTLSLPLTFAGDGVLNYRFYASDGQADATGNPAANSSLTIKSTSDTPPILTWVNGTCRTGGVEPALGAGGTDFNFLVKYTDIDNQCPTTGNIQVWIDTDNNGVYDSGEKYNLTAVNTDDTNCADGKLYSLTRQINMPGTDNQNDLKYRFQASDGIDNAVGTPTSDQTFTVVNAYKVRPAGGTGWYSTIQSAIDASNSAHTVLVYDGTYNENLSFSGSDDNNTTVRSVCGPADTTIQGDGTTYVVYFHNNTGSTIDGFQIIGGSTANTEIYLNAATSTINNSKIHDCKQGIKANGSTLTVSNSEFYNLDNDYGSAIHLSSGSNHVITNSIFHNNTAASSGTGGGGAVYIQNTSATITDSTFKNNTSKINGGAIYVNNSSVHFFGCSLIDNTATKKGGAIDMINASSSAEFTNSIIAGNKAAAGGAIFTNGAPVTFINSTVADNQAVTGSGGVILTSNSSVITVRNSILWDNQAATGGHFVFFNHGSLIMSNIVMNNDSDGNFGDAPYVAGILSPPTVNGYQSENDPFFVNAAGRDYHLTISSDAIDHADSTYAPAKDIAGTPRPQGQASDIGAYEFVK
ncbi:choice-of-anchor Q domain-containing protein [Desulfobacterota bacterium M19]